MNQHSQKKGAEDIFLYVFHSTSAKGGQEGELKMPQHNANTMCGESFGSLNLWDLDWSSKKTAYYKFDDEVSHKWGSS